MTTLGFRTQTPLVAAHQRPLRVVPLVTTAARASSEVPAVGRWMRVGAIGLRAALRYLLVWAAVVFGVVLIVLVGSYLILSVLGVTGAVSRALAVILEQPLPESGVLALLQPGTVLPAAVLVSGALAGLWLVSALAAVLVHNAVTSLTGGIRIRIRTDAPVPGARGGAATPPSPARLGHPRQ